ncbi:MAG: hypothetical protein V4725_02455 [Bacteroidota bacterium]|nr:hypothetical protein [Ferruginibacter sp.]
MNWFILIPVCIIILVLIIFLVKRNFKDQKDLEHKLNEDYPKPKGHVDDIEVDNITK